LIEEKSEIEEEAERGEGEETSGGFRVDGEKEVEVKSVADLKFVRVEAEPSEVAETEGMVEDDEMEAESVERGEFETEEGEGGEGAEPRSRELDCVNGW